MRFEDIDKFLAMIRVIEKHVGPLHEFHDSKSIGEKYGFNPNEMPDIKRERIESWIEEVARGSSMGQTLLLSGVGHSSVDFRWFVDLSADLTAVSVSETTAIPVAEILARLEGAVESHTVPMRRSNGPVIEPVRAADAAQRRHDDQLAIRINRAGMLWGGLAGVIGGGVVQGIVALLAQARE